MLTEEEEMARLLVGELTQEGQDVTVVGGLRVRNQAGKRGGAKRRPSRVTLVSPSPSRAGPCQHEHPSNLTSTCPNTTTYNHHLGQET